VLVAGHRFSIRALHSLSDEASAKQL
jgi:hypothetical protein